jgi:hypothetical protein
LPRPECVARQDFELLEGNHDIFLGNAKEAANADDSARYVAVAIDHKIGDLANLVMCILRCSARTWTPLFEIKSEVEDELRNALAGLKPEEAAVLAMLPSRLAKEFARRYSLGDPVLL